MTATPPLRPRPDDQRLVRGHRFVLRRLSAPLRSLPHFLIVGTMKSGTSSLFSYLARHPKMKPPLRKETHYFGLGVHHGRGEGWYRAHFPRTARLEDGAITGEATPGYMFSPGAIERIAATLPEARLIVLLRNPVDRAISHYFHEIRMGREYLPIDEALAAEDERLADAAAGPDGLETHMHASYKAQGIYADQLERVLAHFPRKQVLVQGSGTLFHEPERALDEALGFLGLDGRIDGTDFEVKNGGSNRIEVPEDVRRGLEAYFAPHNDRLFDLLGRRLDW